MNGKDEKDCDLYAGTTLVLLLQSGALWNQWILVVHFQMALLRLFIEVLVEFVRFAPRVFFKQPRGKILIFRASLHLCALTVFTVYVGGVATDTPTY